MGQILYMSIMFTLLSVFLIGLYGVSVGSVDLFNTINQISGPWPTVSNGKCTFSTDGLSGSCNVLDAVELGGVWFFAVIGSGLYRVGALFYLSYQFFTILNSFRSFPYLGWFFGSLMLIMTLEFWKLFRSGHTS
jgi:hypothetical protein